MLLAKEAEDCVPAFLKHIAHDVYVCGKTINLLKLCCPQVSEEPRSPLLSSPASSSGLRVRSPQTWPSVLAAAGPARWSWDVVTSPSGPLSSMRAPASGSCSRREGKQRRPEAEGQRVLPCSSGERPLGGEGLRLQGNGQAGSGSCVWGTGLDRGLCQRPRGQGWGSIFF